MFLAYLFFLSFSAQAKTIHLGLGHSEKLPVTATSEVRVEKGQVIDVTAQGETLNIYAKSLGRSYLEVDGQKHLVVVSSQKRLNQWQSLKTLVNGLPGLRVRRQNNELIVYGELQNIKHWQELAKSSIDYTFAASIPPRLQLQVELFLSELIAMGKYSQPQIRTYPQASVTTGGPNLQKRQQLQKYLKPYGLLVSHHKENLEIRPTVRVHIQVVEVNRKWGRDIGLSWPGAYTAKLLPKPITYSDLSLTLKAMENSGQGQVLASPTLLSRSGGQAQFLAGGEFAIRTSNYSGKSVTWKKHGVLLEVKPKADALGRLHIDIVSEVSLIDQSQSVDGIPALKTNRVSTQFDLTSPQTVYLSGLVQKTHGRSEEGWPGLMNIPILGRLFSSESYQNDETELVIFLTPEIVGAFEDEKYE